MIPEKCRPSAVRYVMYPTPTMTTGPTVGSVGVSIVRSEAHSPPSTPTTTPPCITARLEGSKKARRGLGNEISEKKEGGGGGEEEEEEQQQQQQQCHHHNSSTHRHTQTHRHRHAETHRYTHEIPANVTKNSAMPRPTALPP